MVCCNAEVLTHMPPSCEDVWSFPLDTVVMSFHSIEDIATQFGDERTVVSDMFKVMQTP